MNNTTSAERDQIQEFANRIVQLTNTGVVVDRESAVNKIMAEFNITRARAIAHVSLAARISRHSVRNLPDY